MSDERVVTYHDRQVTAGEEGVDLLRVELNDGSVWRLRVSPGFYFVGGMVVGAALVFALVVWRG